jgi:hypothetical protein
VVRRHPQRHHRRAVAGVHRTERADDRVLGRPATRPVRVAADARDRALVVRDLPVARTDRDDRAHPCRRRVVGGVLDRPHRHRRRPASYRLVERPVRKRVLQAG